MDVIAGMGLRPLLAAAALWCAATFDARAETFDTCAGFIDSVPTTITTQGTWCLRQDLSTAIASGAAITVATNNVTIDCNDFKIGGLAAGNGTQTVGILASGRLNASVRNCTVRGFYVGVSLSGGGHSVAHSRFDNNTYTGIYVEGTGGMIRGNRILDTGGSPSFPYAMGIHARDGARIIDNQVVGVTGRAGSGGAAYGILTYSLFGSVRDNEVSQVFGDDGGSSYGISNNAAPSNMSIRGNDVTFSPAVTAGTGISCNGGSAKDNLVGGHANGISGSCVDGGGNTAVP